MKKIVFVFVLGLFAMSSFAQTVSESTIKKISLGYDLYNTFWLNLGNVDGTTVDSRSVNQGINVFAMYNHDLNENGFSVAIGLGISSENLYVKNQYVPNVNADVVSFVSVPTGLSASRSKMNFTYLDIPIELRLKNEKDVHFGLGFKFGINMDSKTLYKGSAFSSSGEGLGYIDYLKLKKINQLEKYRFGVQLRGGYKWVSVYAYYALNKVFIADKGPQMQALQIGVTFMPF
jgi:hypothetical protein